MDTRSNPRAQDTAAETSKGCCGGGGKTAPETAPGTAKDSRLADDKNPEKAAKTGCCCSGG